MPAILPQLATGIARAEALEATLHTSHDFCIKHGLPLHYLLLLSDAISHTNTTIHKLKILYDRLQHAIATAKL